MSNTIRALIRRRWQPNGWDGSIVGCLGNNAANWYHSGSVSHEGRTGTGLPVVTERGNSMITGTWPASMPGLPMPPICASSYVQDMSPRGSPPETKKASKAPIAQPLGSG